MTPQEEIQQLRAMVQSQEDKIRILTTQFHNEITLLNKRVGGCWKEILEHERREDIHGR